MFLRIAAAALVMLSSLSAMSLKQLRDGALAVTLEKMEGAKSAKQQNDGMLFLGYYWGYFQAIQNDSWLHTGELNETVARPKQVTTPEWMFKVDRASTSILEFIGKAVGDKDIPNMEAGPMMAAWILWNSPENGGRNKFLAVELLKTSLGASFGGFEEMRTVMSSELAKEIIVNSENENSKQDDPEYLQKMRDAEGDH